MIFEFVGATQYSVFYATPPRMSATIDDVMHSLDQMKQTIQKVARENQMILAKLDTILNMKNKRREKHKSDSESDSDSHGKSAHAVPV